MGASGSHDEYWNKPVPKTQISYVYPDLWYLIHSEQKVCELVGHFEMLSLLIVCVYTLDERWCFFSSLCTCSILQLMLYCCTCDCEVHWNYAIVKIIRKRREEEGGWRMLEGREGESITMLLSLYCKICKIY